MYSADNVSEALPKIARSVLQQGEEVGSRVGRTMELINQTIVLGRPWQREVLVEGRKASLPAQIAETMWVLAGRNDVKWLSHYLPRAPEFSDDGVVWRGGYGPRLRAWRSHVLGIDQLRHVVDLLAGDPLTRRAVISIYDPAVDTEDGKDIPCNDFLMFQSRLGRLHMHVTTRSNDLIWGWSGINQFEWSALQEIVAGLLGLKVGELHFSIGSLHIYERHWQKAGRFQEIVGFADSPRFSGSAVNNYGGAGLHPIQRLDRLVDVWFEIEAEIRRQAGLPVRERNLEEMIENFPEPMMRSWLAVLAWWWTGEKGFLERYPGTRLQVAATLSPNRPSSRKEEPKPPEKDAYIEFVDNLHREKHAVYGDSWKRRGEMLGIMANIARKVDRLGVGGAGDTAADTAIDLEVYLAKYRLWLAENRNAPLPFGVRVDVDHVDQVLDVLTWVHRNSLRAASTNDVVISTVKTMFEQLARVVENQDTNVLDVVRHVDGLLRLSDTLGRRLWEAEQKVDYQNPYRNITDEDDDEGTL